MKKKISAFTIIASNYIPQASILIDSYTKLHPDHNFFLIFIDDKKKKVKNVISINASEIDNIPNLNEIRFKYDITEYSTCLKPYATEYITNKYGTEKIMYIDPDICFYNRLDLVIEKLDTYDCVLIPHITKPYEDKYNPTETEIAKVGLYNLGFAAFKSNKKTIQFLHWWQNKLNLFCYNDPEEFMFTDQKWMDFAPVYLNTYIVREKGYDVAYWNLHEYIGVFPIEKIVFFHFSGFVINDVFISKYQNRFKLKEIKEYRKLFNDYAKKMKSLVINEENSYKYPYNYFSNGDSISLTIRRIYGKMNKDNFLRLDKNPFNVKPINSFYNYLLNKNSGSGMPNIVHDIYFTNRNIQKEYPHLEFNQDNFECREYVSWLLAFGEREYGISERLLHTIIVNKQIKNTQSGRFKKDRIVSLIEQIKKNYNGKLFVQKIYNILLKRDPDDLGLSVNLQDIRKNHFYKNRVIYRLINSKEFRRKSKLTIELKVYIYFLVFITYIYKSFEFFLNFFSKKNNSEVGINIIGYIDTESGVGESARGMIRAFKSTDIPITIINIEQPWLRRDNHEFTSLFTNQPKYKINLLCINADQVENVVKNCLKTRILKNRYNIGYWYWESDVFPNQYKNAFKYFDEIWVASEYIKKALEKISPIPVFVIPPLFIELDTKLIESFDFYKHHIDINSSDFVYLNLFDSASFWERKNPFTLIRSFKKAFNNKTDVKLIIKTTEIKKSKVYPKLFNEIKSNKNIILLDKYLSKIEINQLENRANCYVSLHRSEGLGIPLIESMFLKKPVIATGFGGNTDFMNSRSSFLVKYRVEKLKSAIGPYPKNSDWAIPDINQAAFIMKFVYEKRVETKAIAKNGGLRIRKLYNSEKIGKLIKSRLQEFLY